MEVYKLVDVDSDEAYAEMASMGWETRDEADAALAEGGVDGGYLVGGASEGESEEVDTTGMERVSVQHWFTMGDSSGAQYWYSFDILAYKAADGTLYGEAEEIDNNC